MPPALGAKDAGAVRDGTALLGEVPSGRVSECFDHPGRLRRVEGRWGVRAGGRGVPRIG